MENNIRIRTFWGPMPFDRADASGFGLVHATGREIFRDGRWMYEYEDDYTIDLPDTDDPVDYDDYLEDEEDEDFEDLGPDWVEEVCLPAYWEED